MVAETYSRLERLNPLWQSAKKENFMAQGRTFRFNHVFKMESLSLHSPAKINLMLSVHGKREDGFHELTSLVAPLDFGDRLTVGLAGNGVDCLHCDDVQVPSAEENLIIRAAHVFRETIGESVYFHFDLEKRIPMGAGLGGGSSNAAVALKAMNELLGRPLPLSSLVEVAARLGSDCPLFIDSLATVMTGRGEILEPLEESLLARIRGQKVALFKPDFSINTAWAYGELLRRAPEFYSSADLASARLSAFRQTGGLADLLFNSFEEAVGRKYLAIPCLLEMLRANGHRCLLSGTGSCCFALVDGEEELRAIRQLCMEALGKSIFFIESSVI